MRYLLFSFFFLGFISAVVAQPVTASFDQAKTTGISFTELDSLYPSAAHAMANKGVFSKNQSQFLQEYRNMMQEFGQFLMEHGFKWGGRTSFFQRIYFNNDGTIDYYFVNLDQSQLSAEKKKRFKKLLQKFSANYQFPMKAESNFAQCAPITFVDPKSTKQKSKN